MMATVSSQPSARAEPAAPASYIVEIHDDETGGLYELHGLDGEVVDRCLYPCVLRAPAGEYRLVSIRGRRRRTLDLKHDHDESVTARKGDRTGLAVGIPIASLGLAFSFVVAVSVSLRGQCMLECADQPTSTKPPPASWTVEDYTYLGVGLAGIATGVLLMTTLTHAASFKVDVPGSAISSLSMTAVPTPSGGVFALSGSF
ncbi:MAG: hypothetical protein ACHREM_08660 [Polyangiales bacterium]